MNTAEKLRFLADRIVDKKEFVVIREFTDNSVYKFINYNLLVLNHLGEYQPSILKIDDLLLRNLKLKPKWEFTEDEKAILRNLPDYCKWIARDKTGWLQLFQEKPQKLNAIWSELNWTSFSLFDKAFQSIQWEDAEPCEFRRYL